MRKQQITHQVSKTILDKAYAWADDMGLAKQVAIERLIAFGLVYLREQEDKLKK